MTVPFKHHYFGTQTKFSKTTLKKVRKIVTRKLSSIKSNEVVKIRQILSSLKEVEVYEGGKLIKYNGPKSETDTVLLDKDSINFLYNKMTPFILKVWEFEGLIFEGLINVSSQETFAFPTDKIMFVLLPIFKPKLERLFRTDSVIQEETKPVYDFETDTTKEETTRIYLLSDNKKITAKAESEFGRMFQGQLEYREQSQAKFIRQAFCGAEGLRHLFAFCIGLHEAGKTGLMDFELNQHIGYLGYGKNNRGFQQKIRQKSSDLFRLFVSLKLTVSKKNGNKEEIAWQKFFTVWGGKMELVDNQIINEKIKIQSNPVWYDPNKMGSIKIDSKKQQSPQYINLLRKIATEDHQKHGITLFLFALFGIFWRMEETKKLSVLKVLEWCDMGSNSTRLLADIRKLESELNYMVKQGYLGLWSNNGKPKLPSECENPLECVLTFIPPDWMKADIEIIKNKREEYRPLKANKLVETMSTDQFNEVLKESGLSGKAFADKVGVSAPLISQLKKGKAKVSKKLANKIKDVLF